MKKIILLTCITALTVLIVVTSQTIDFEKAAIRIIERAARIEIEYEELSGNILSGYQVQHYVIRFSQTDSIYGAMATIHYRFKASLLRLPNLFEIILAEPTVDITRKAPGKREGRFQLPRFSFGLRINMKNGTLIYRQEPTLRVRGISGLLFIDLIGTLTYINARNLSFHVENSPLRITSANIEMRVSTSLVDIRSYRIKGKGFSATGDAQFLIADDDFICNLSEADFSLSQLGIHSGDVSCNGRITIHQNNFYPQLKGIARNVAPTDYLEFETNHLSDTIYVNIFNCELWGGNVFAQVTLHDNKVQACEANYSDVNIGDFLGREAPVMIQGYAGYKNGKFMMFTQSPAQDRPEIDSVYLYGTYEGSSITIDSLSLRNKTTTLMAQGAVYPRCDLMITLNNFDITRYARLFLPDPAPTGIIAGTCRVEGSVRQFDSLVFTGTIRGKDFVIGDFHSEEIYLKADDFNIARQSKYLLLAVKTPAYKKIMFDSLSLALEERIFQLGAYKGENDRLRILGSLDGILKGTISTITLYFNNVEITNESPIIFDHDSGYISEIDISLAGGSLKASIEPLAIVIERADLSVLGQLAGMRIPISGTLDCVLREDRFDIEIQEAHFVGLHNGTLKARGTYQNQQILIDSLIIDDESQRARAHGTLSTDRSSIEGTFENVGVWIFPFLKKFMLNPDGRMTGTVGFDGNLQNFSFRGGGRIHDASFGVLKIESTFDSVSANVSFDKNHIIFADCRGLISRLHKPRSGAIERAIVNAGGVVSLGPRFRLEGYNFDFSFKDAPLQYQPFAYGTGSGTFNIGEKNKVTYYNGSITVKQAIVPIEFGEEVVPAGGDAGDDNYTMNLRIRGERNIWLRNSDADIEFGGELYVVKEQGPLYITGTLTTRRGNYYWLNHALPITEGYVTFIPEETIDGELDVWAEMNTKDREPRTGEIIIIKLHLFGMMSEPILEFYSEPPYYTEQDIVTYLNLNITWRDLESMKQGDYVGTVLPHSIITWLESDVSRRVRQYTGLDYFWIDTPFFEDDSKTRLTVGKYISKNLFITYTYDITSFSNEFNVEYFIDDKNEILVRRDEEGEYSLQYQYRIRF